MTKKISLALLAFVVLAVAAPAMAQSVVDAAAREQIRGVPDKWTLDLGSYWQAFDTRLRLYGENEETGTKLDTESDLGLPDNQTNFMVTGTYRFTDRSSVELVYLGWDRSKTWTIEEEIVWGDATYEAGATIESRLDGKMINAIYKYDFYNTGKVTFGGNAGLATMTASAKLRGEGTLAGEGGTVTGEVSESASATVPIPVLGLHFDLALTKRLIWKGEGNFFALKAGGWDSNVNLIGTSLAYYFTRNVGIGAGFNTTTIKIDKTGKRGGELDARIGFSGVNAYMSFAF